MREDPSRRGLLYCGTETGVWVSLDDGGAWQRLRGNLPVAPIHDLIVKDTDLVVATHGRSFWILDDLSPLHQMTDATASADAHLFAPRPAVRWRAYRGHGMKPGPNREVAYRLAGSMGYAYRQIESPTGEKQERPLDAGENPPNGVIVHYWLKEAPAGDITLAFLDADGREIRSFTSRRRDAAREPATADASPGAGGGEEPRQEQDASVGAPDDEPRLTKSAGANRFVWNLRAPDAARLPDNKGRGGTAEMLAGPRMPPGSYQVRLTVGGRTLTQPFEIVKDPRVQATDEDLARAVHLGEEGPRSPEPGACRGADPSRRARPGGGVGGPSGVTGGQGSRAGARADADVDRGGAHPGPLGQPAHVPREAQLRGSRRSCRLVEYSDSAPTQALRELIDSLALPGGDGAGEARPVPGRGRRRVQRHLP